MAEEDEAESTAHGHAAMIQPRRSRHRSRWHRHDYRGSPPRLRISVNDFIFGEFERCTDLDRSSISRFQIDDLSLDVALTCRVRLDRLYFDGPAELSLNPRSLGPVS